MEAPGRYDASSMPEAQFEPRSNDTVLRNLRGITSADEMDRVEAETLEAATGKLAESYDARHRFVAEDIRHMHRLWLSSIYAWAPGDTMFVRDRLHGGVAGARHVGFCTDLATARASGLGGALGCLRQSCGIAAASNENQASGLF